MSSLVVLESFVMFDDLKEEKVKVTLIRNDILVLLIYTVDNFRSRLNINLNLVNPKI